MGTQAREIAGAEARSRILVRSKNPCPEGKVQVQRLCRLNNSVVLLDEVVPTTSNLGVANESISKAITNNMALPISSCMGTQIQVSDTDWRDWGRFRGFAGFLGRP